MRSKNWSRLNFTKTNKVSAPLFADTLKLTRTAPNLWSGEADTLFSNGDNRQFGGWVAALLLKAVLGSGKPTQTQRAIVVHFLAAVRPGALAVRVTPMREGRSVSYWQAELLQEESVCVHAVITLGEGRTDPFAVTAGGKPDAVPPDTPGLGRFTPPVPFGKELQARWVEGAPFEGAAPNRSVFWSGMTKPNRLDAAKLAFLADFVPPRIFYAAQKFVPSSTLSMTVYFHATQAELDAVGEDYVLAEAHARRIEAGYWDHSVSFWSPHGPLLATTEQLALHRG